MALAFAGTSAGAQVLTEGTRVRVLIPTIAERQLQGRVISLGADTLSLRDVHGYLAEGVYFARNVSVPRRAVTTLEYLQGRDRANGALYGAMIGLIPTVIAYYDAKSKDYGEYSELHMIVVGAISIPTFALIGSYLGPARWKRVLPWP